ncbi:AAA family ATPase [Rhodoferax sp.]|uniref:ExeA family protein n=1 Tax=Rhodoferax sp. TaxID=50421 RepID=UPI00284523C2|nr:AAA family ATPase [Rhodoferax sp.]MDR3371898.1 AAA family ATPase [Rhodoferax sp.]
MYAHHFGLTQDPFSIAPDPRYLFMSERHREALAHLLYGVAGGASGGFVLLTGDIGTGKTTVCRCFLEQIPPGCHVAYIFNPKLTVTELLQSICDEFHIPVTPAVTHLPTVKDYIDALNSFLLTSHAAGQSCVLIIDEAQNLSTDVLEQLRLLTNLETNERKLLQIVLIGQPELRSMLTRPELEQLAQRVIARFHLDALNEQEANQYIAHRLAVAGHTGRLPFDKAALQRIHRLARGVPRRINLLCGRALLGAWSSGASQVGKAIVNKAASEVFESAVNSSDAPAGGRQRFRLLAFGLLGGALLMALIVGVYPRRVASLLAAVPPQPPASSTATRAAVTSGPLPMEELDALLPHLPTDLNSAWHALATVWKLPATEGDPCQLAKSLQLQCYRTSNLTLPVVRQLGQPGILTLQDSSGPARFALLTGLTEQTATLLVAGRPHTIRLVTLGRLWRGEFATYWRLPPGYSAEMRDGDTSAAIAQLDRQLSTLEGAPAAAAVASAPTLNAALRERIKAFQRARGLTPDGRPGPITFMQIDSASHVTQPRLQTAPQ